MASSRMPDELAQALTLAVETGLMTGAEVYQFACDHGDDWWLAAVHVNRRNSARSWRAVNRDEIEKCREISRLTNLVTRTLEPAVRV